MRLVREHQHSEIFGAVTAVIALTDKSHSLSHIELWHRANIWLGVGRNEVLFHILIVEIVNCGCFIELGREMKIRKLFEQLEFLALIRKPCIAADTDISACLQIYALILFSLLLSLIRTIVAGLHCDNDICPAVYLVLKKMIFGNRRYVGKQRFYAVFSRLDLFVVYSRNRSLRNSFYSVFLIVDFFNADKDKTNLAVHIVIAESAGGLEYGISAAGRFLVFNIIRLNSTAFNDVASHFLYVFTFHRLTPKLDI